MGNLIIWAGEGNCARVVVLFSTTYHMTTLKKNDKVRTVGSCDTLGKLASKCVGIECKDIISAWFNGSPETAVGAKSGVAQGIMISGVPVSLSPAWVQEQLDSMTGGVSSSSLRIRRYSSAAGLYVSLATAPSLISGSNDSETTERCCGRQHRAAAA